MKKIIFYKRSGEKEAEKELTIKNLEYCHGQLIRCRLISNEEEFLTEEYLQVIEARKKLINVFN